jgi:hypothetical protein
VAASLHITTEELGLEHLKGSPAMAVFHRIKILEQGDAIGAAVLEQVCALDDQPSMISFVAIQGARGTYRGFETYLCSEIHSPSIFMMMVLFPKPEQQKLLLFREGFLSRVGKRLFKSQDLQLGDEKLDALVMVQSSDPEATLKSLRRPPLRSALLDLYEKHPDAVINDVGIRLRLNSPTSSELRSALDLISQVVEAL